MDHHFLFVNKIWQALEWLWPSRDTSWRPWEEEAAPLACKQFNAAHRIINNEQQFAPTGSQTIQTVHRIASYHKQHVKVEHVMYLRIVCSVSTTFDISYCYVDDITDNNRLGHATLVGYCLQGMPICSNYWRRFEMFCYGSSNCSRLISTD